MPSIRAQKIGGLTFVRIHVAGRCYCISLCRTSKSHILAA